MKKWTIAIWFLAALTVNLPAQQDQRAEFEARLIAATNKMSALQGDFKQIKTLVFMDEAIESFGKFKYNNNDYILWQYERPYEYTIELSDGKLIMDDGKNRNEIDMNSTKSFQSMNDLFFRSIKGDVLDIEGQYNISIKEQPSSYLVNLIPVESGMASFVTDIELIFEESSMLVSSVSINESSGDKTQLIFTNHRVNE